MDIPRISVEEAKAIFDEQNAVFVDIRDPASYQARHIPNAHHVNDHNIEDFIAEADKSRPHIIYCYHGNSSQGGTAYFLEQGFQNVKSMDGGFAYWQQFYPETVE